MRRRMLTEEERSQLAIDLRRQIEEAAKPASPVSVFVEEETDEFGKPVYRITASKGRA